MCIRDRCSIDRVSSAPVDTDSSPYDKGSFASSTTYVTGMAMVLSLIHI